VAIVPSRKIKTHAALSEFALWFDYGLEPSIHNVLELKKINPPGLKNPVLLFVVPRAMNYVVERFVLEVVQSWEILNKVLKQQNLRTLGVTDRDFRHLKKIRNKLVAHKVENSLATARYLNWYRKRYGNFESVLALVLRVAERIRTKIRMLEANRKIILRGVSTRGVQRFDLIDVEALLASLKASGIY
jgi:hypothetical protein